MTFFQASESQIAAILALLDDPVNMGLSDETLSTIMVLLQTGQTEQVIQFLAVGVSPKRKTRKGTGFHVATGSTEEHAQGRT